MLCEAQSDRVTSSSHYDRVDNSYTIEIKIPSCTEVLVLV